MAQTINPLDSLRSAIVFDARDWSIGKIDSWIYAIVVGWENEDPLEGETEDDALNEICDKHGWDKERLKILRKNFISMEAESAKQFKH